MCRRRMATAAVLLALIGAACSGKAGTSDKGVQVLGESFSRSDAPSTTVASSSSSSTASTDTTATTAPSSTPATDEPTTTTAPAPASITVNYQPHDGGSATATLEETGQTQSLESGSTVFGDLVEGTYTVHVTIEQPGADPTTGTATYINRSRPIELHPGDNAVIDCDDTGCSTGVL